MVSRCVKNQAHYKKRLTELGFSNPSVTALDKDGLNQHIYDLKPEILLMGARFYQCCTPFLMKQLKSNFPKTKMAALSVGEYPSDLAMYFILNGINSYVTTFDGIEEWYKGLEDVRRGKEYIAPAVVEKIDMRRDEPAPAGNISDHHKAIILMMCNGFQDVEIADILYISLRTVTTHKTKIFTSLNVRGPNELIRTALYLGYIQQEGIYFYPKDFILNPLPEEKILKRVKNEIRDKGRKQNLWRFEK